MAGGWGPFGGLLTELLGVIGPLSVLWRVVGGRLVGCCPNSWGSLGRCWHRGRWLGVLWWVVDRTTRGHWTAAGTAAGGWGPFGGLLSEQFGAIRTVVGTAAGGWGPFGGLLSEQFGAIRTVVGTAAGGWGPFGGLLSEQFGAIRTVVGTAAGGWGPFGGLLSEQFGAIRTVVGTAAGGWGPFGGLLSEQFGVFGPLPAPCGGQGCLVGC